MKIKREAVIVFFSAIFLCVFINGSKIESFIFEKVVGVSVLDEENMIKLTAEKELKQGMVTLLINNADAAYDKTKNVVYIPQNIELNEYIGKLTTEDGGYKLYIKKDKLIKNKARAIESGYAFTLYAVGKEDYYKGELVFTGMPIMNIYEDEEIAYNYDRKNRLIRTGYMVIDDPYRNSATTLKSSCSFHVRGGSSYNYEKSNYKLELDDGKQSLLGLRKSKDYILNSLYDDAGLIHNKVCMNIWEKISEYNSVPNDEGIQGEYLELFINNEYKGVYLLTERIDKSTLSLGEKDKLYKCRADRVPEEYNYTNEMTDEMYPIFVLKYPKEDVPENWVTIKQWVNYYLKDGIDSYEEGKAFLNLENAIDYNIFNLLIYGVDNIRKNVYFIARYNEDGTYQIEKVPWDMNETLGNIWIDMSESNFTLYDAEGYKDVYTWTNDVNALYYENPLKISQKIYNRWNELRQSGVISEKVIIEILKMEMSYLHETGAYERNYEKWPHGIEYWDESYAYEYVKKRIPFLDEYFRQLCIDNSTDLICDGVNYTDEFEAKYYWDTNYEELIPWMDYGRETLLNHYIYYGKPFGLKGRKE